MARYGSTDQDPDPAYRQTDHPVWNRVERFIEPFEDTGREVLPQNAWQFIAYFARQARGPFVVLLVIGGLVGAVDAALYWGVGWLIDILDSSSPATLLADHGWELAGLLALLLFVRAAVMVGAAVIEQQVIVPRFYTMVRWQSFRRVIEQPYAFFQDDFAGRIATKIAQAGESVGDFIITSLQSLWSFLTFIALTVIVLSTLDWRMGVVVAVWGLGYGLVVRYLLPRLRAAGKNNANERSVLNGRLVDIFTNILTVKLFDAGRREHGDVKQAMGNYLGAVTHLTRMITLVRTSVAVLNGLMMSAVAVLAVSGWMAGTVSTGAIAATMGLVFRLNQMSGWMMFNINGLIRAFSTVQDAIETISVEPVIRDRPGAPAIAPVAGHIRFETVRFNYGKGDVGLFDGLDLDIKPGEKVGLVGPSGAGKSTIVSLMLRLFEPETGRITIDGTDIASVTQTSLRQQFGVVSQEPSLMHRSLSDNIGYGTPDATEETIEAAAIKAKAHEFILDARDPKGRAGYDAHVGERGIKLSGGQRQRVAIARVMLKDAPILILDEATSALDSEIEAAIQDNLASLMDGKTVIAIAHRLSTIAAMDRLVVLDNGRIVQTGRHDVLLRDEDGLYARMWGRQSGGFLSFAEAAE
ncbi:MAG: ABC transporter ATP-binding protein [Roseitalea sp.]|jgi:ATP-binding cassette subfamily B protein/ATP-binding cassette subfamily B multidrug efflux pump|nr:ABC transporter ATP-binding protein [Roseitalea sp.]MBO6723100.1 ABC transporter ATP-binding protein [Roseitalea sp.]MBO6742462.1 ABC transporter ATP-binding protein [Roseitalea sp.]